MNYDSIPKVIYSEAGWVVRRSGGNDKVVIDHDCIKASTIWAWSYVFPSDDFSRCCNNKIPDGLLFVARLMQGG